MRAQQPVGTVTRGTTHPNRLRRIDRWVLARHGQVLRRAPDPLVVDLGFGTRPTTTLELADRLRRVNPAVRVVGVEIDPARVAQAASLHAPGVTFVLGGFEIPVGGPVLLVRAANVLRQYDPQEVGAAWQRMRSALAPAGMVVDATTDELGRLCSWVTLDGTGPRWFTVSIDVRRMSRPSEVAARLPKALIHRNVPGEPVHELLTCLDQGWQRQAAVAPSDPGTDSPRRSRHSQTTAGQSAARPHGGGWGSSPSIGRR
ncbi:MAG TPA: class I SAM-dependent methyltransferase [Dermatophilaceae bacterium]|nr:class I SAM-dependent methyltransferase [Dermatophilaceae bacterium]